MPEVRSSGPNKVPPGLYSFRSFRGEASGGDWRSLVWGSIQNISTLKYILVFFFSVFVRLLPSSSFAGL